MSDFAIVHYKVSKYYEKNNEAGILWNDEMLNIKWPVKNPIISLKDKNILILKIFYLNKSKFLLAYPYQLYFLLYKHYLYFFFSFLILQN